MPDIQDEIEKSEWADIASVMPHRRPWLVVLLALVTGAFVFVYCGRLRRALGWIAVWWVGVLPVFGATILYLPHGKVALYGALTICLLGIIAQVVDALRVSKQQAGQPWLAYQKWWAYLILLVGASFGAEWGLYVIRNFWCEAYVVPANSMKETLLSGDRFMVEKLFFDTTSPNRGDVVAFYLPHEPSTIYVKRIITLADETIAIEEDQVLIDGEPLTEPYAQFLGDPPQNLEGLRDFRAQVVPNGHVFVMGDNRWLSNDSRFWGTVPKENLIGEARLIFWSREHTFHMPTRENPRGSESWGSLRWDRIGKLVE